MITGLIGIVIGFIIGILVGRRNKQKVEAAVSEVKKYTGE